jgi:hypothetical protein
MEHVPVTTFLFYLPSILIQGFPIQTSLALIALTTLIILKLRKSK